MTRTLACLLALVGLACASAPTGTPPGASGAWGYVELVPREGVKASGGGGAYGDRRLSGVRLVDYSRPGFVVVYTDGEPDADGRVELVLREGATGPRLEPGFSAVGAGGTIAIRNDTGEPQVVSAREDGRLESLAPGGTTTFAATEAGEHRFSLLSEAAEDARVFVAPGPFAVVTESGRFELTGVAPGRQRLVAWHPRFPSTTHWVELAAGETRRLDIEIGVDRPHEIGR